MNLRVAINLLSLAIALASLATFAEEDLERIQFKKQFFAILFSITAINIVANIFVP